MLIPKRQGDQVTGTRCIPNLLTSLHILLRGLRDRETEETTQWLCYETRRQGDRHVTAVIRRVRDKMRPSPCDRGVTHLHHWVLLSNDYGVLETRHKIGLWDRRGDRTHVLSLTPRHHWILLCNDYGYLETGQRQVSRDRRRQVSQTWQSKLSLSTSYHWLI